MRTRPLGFPLQGIAWSPDGKSIAVNGDTPTSCAASRHRRRGGRHRNGAADARLARRVAPGLAARRERVARQRAGVGGRVVQPDLLGRYPSGDFAAADQRFVELLGPERRPDGRSFVRIRNERRAAIWTMPPTDAAKAVGDHGRGVGRRGGAGLAWTPDGRIVYTTEASGNPDIWIMNADGIAPRAADVHPGHRHLAARDAGRPVHRLRLGSRRRHAAWRMALDGSGATQLTADPIGRLASPLERRQVDLLRWPAGRTPPGADRGWRGRADLPARYAGGLAEPLPRGFHEAMVSPDGTPTSPDTTTRIAASASS